jgi:UDPglucose 6-dehydrogenase
MAGFDSRHFFESRKDYCMEKKILIAGNGIVGGNMRKLFPEADIHDPPQGIFVNPEIIYDVAFICVPTPCKSSGECETSIVEQAISQVSAKIYCIRSTVPPGTCQELALTTGKHIVFMPEYYGETVHANKWNYNFIILAGAKEDTNQVAEVFKRINTGELRVFQTIFETAELVKYMENCFLGLKVTFCNEFERIGRKIGVDYNDLRELFIADPRVGRSHTFVYADQPYYESKCLDKDIPALIEFAKSIGIRARLMETVKETNDNFKAESLKK